MENKRLHRRAGIRKESNLTKYTSHPELQILAPGHPRFQCQQCGFVNTLFPLCLCCTWASKEPEHGFNASITRARRASAPAIVVKLYVKEQKDTKNPHDHQRRLMVSRSMSLSPSTLGIREEETPATMIRRSLSNGDQKYGDELPNTMASSEVVATATSSSPPVFAQDQTTTQGEESLGLKSERDSCSIPCSLPSEEQPILSVERLSAIMPPTRSSRNLRVRRSHQVLSISIHDSEMPSSSPGHDHHKNDDSQRTIRRRKHLNILQKPVADSDTAATEPIAISLNIHRPSVELDSKADILEPSHPLSRSLSHPHSATSESSNGDSTLPPLDPTLLPPSPTSDPSSLITFAPSSSPVRLGHPSRPYYSAIRKNGISPPPSRPSSVSGPSPSSPRPKSYTPSSSLPIPSTANTATRHLSMSSMFVSPALASPPGAFSAFSVMDDADLEDDDNDDPMPVLPPTPAPGRTRFSLVSSADRRRFSHGPLTGSSSSSVGPRLHNHSQSLSQARSKALGGSIGFSMSGETELRMALAQMGAADSGGVATGFRFREPAVIPTEPHPRATRHGLMDKVKKLRQGLKDLLFTTSTTTSMTTSTTA